MDAADDDVDDANAGEWTLHWVQAFMQDTDCHRQFAKSLLMIIEAISTTIDGLYPTGALEAMNNCTVIIALHNVLNIAQQI